MTTIVRVQELSRIYGQGDTAVRALDQVRLEVGSGEFLAVMGPSGCGKSTLLHLMGGLDQPSAGEIEIEGKKLSELDDAHLTELRRRRMGFVFQFFNLLPVLTAVENAALPLLLDGVKPRQANEKAAQWLEQLGLMDRGGHYPHQLSGGQQQRVAIARAMVTEPALLLADEPTGNLDSRASDEIAGLLRKAASDWGRTVIMVTHDPRIAAFADRIVFLKDGKIVDEARLSANGHEEAQMVKDRMEAL
jgi:putative ABC transport system ATP-binding protein